MKKTRIQHLLLATLIIPIFVTPLTVTAEVDRFDVVKAVTETRQEITDYAELLTALRDEDDVSTGRYKNILGDAENDLQDAEDLLNRNRFTSALEEIEAANRHIETLEAALGELDNSGQPTSSIQNILVTPVSAEEVVPLPELPTIHSGTNEIDAKRAQLIELIRILTQLIEQP